MIAILPTVIICTTIIACLVLLLKTLERVVILITDTYIATVTPPKHIIDKDIQEQLDNITSKMSGLQLATGIRKR